MRLICIKNRLILYSVLLGRKISVKKMKIKVNEDRKLLNIYKECK